MRSQFAEPGNQRFRILGSTLIAISRSDVHIDAEAPGQMVCDVDIELGMRSSGDGGHNSRHLPCFEVKGRNHVHQCEAARGLAGDEDVGPSLYTGVVEIASDPARLRSEELSQLGATFATGVDDSRAAVRNRWDCGFRVNRPDQGNPSWLVSVPDPSAKNRPGTQKQETNGKRSIHCLSSFVSCLSSLSVCVFGLSSLVFSLFP
jgi:hypothetical protein